MFRNDKTNFKYFVWAKGIQFWRNGPTQIVHIIIIRWMIRAESGEETIVTDGDDNGNSRFLTVFPCSLLHQILQPYSALHELKKFHLCPLVFFSEEHSGDGEGSAPSHSRLRRQEPPMRQNLRHRPVSAHSRRNRRFPPSSDGRRRRRRWSRHRPHRRRLGRHGRRNRVPCSFMRPRHCLHSTGSFIVSRNWKWRIIKCYECQSTLYILFNFISIDSCLRNSLHYMFCFVHVGDSMAWCDKCTWRLCYLGVFG